MQLAKSAAVVVAAAAASGGVALAAASPGGGPAQPGRVLPSAAASQAQEHAAVTLTSHPGGKPNKNNGKAGSHGHPNPNLNGLCHAWLAGAGSKHGKARHSSAFQVLISTAGGVGQVNGYCATVVKTHPSDEPGDDADESTEPKAPAHVGKPAHPDKKSRPSGGRDVSPSASHPKGAPSNVPPVTSPGHS